MRALIKVVVVLAVIVAVIWVVRQPTPPSITARNVVCDELKTAITAAPASQARDLQAVATLAKAMSTDDPLRQALDAGGGVPNPFEAIDLHDRYCPS